MPDTNKDIRSYAASRFVRNYEIFDKLGVSSGKFYSMMRKELSTEQKQEIRTIIDRIAEEKGGDM